MVLAIPAKYWKTTFKYSETNKGNEITGPLVLDKYIVIADYKKQNKKELNLKSGEVVEIVEKTENGELKTESRS